MPKNVQNETSNLSIKAETKRKILWVGRKIKSRNCFWRAEIPRTSREQWYLTALPGVLTSSFSIGCVKTGLSNINQRSCWKRQDCGERSLFPCLIWKWQKFEKLEKNWQWCWNHQWKQWMFMAIRSVYCRYLQNVR